MNDSLPTTDSTSTLRFRWSKASTFGFFRGRNKYKIILDLILTVTLGAVECTLVLAMFFLVFSVFHRQHSAIGALSGLGGCAWQQLGGRGVTHFRRVPGMDSLRLLI